MKVRVLENRFAKNVFGACRPPYGSDGSRGGVVPGAPSGLVEYRQNRSRVIPPLAGRLRESFKHPAGASPERITG